MRPRSDPSHPRHLSVGLFFQRAVFFPNLTGSLGEGHVSHDLEGIGPFSLSLPSPFCLSLSFPLVDPA